MNKYLVIIALAFVMGLFLTACNQPKLEGTWVEPAVEGSLLGEVGFTLLEGGKVENINTGFREYQTWERVGDKLILNGVEHGYVSTSFADTNNIISLDDSLLVIGQDGYSVTFHRK